VRSGVVLGITSGTRGSSAVRSRTAISAAFAVAKTPRRRAEVMPISVSGITVAETADGAFPSPAAAIAR
jgi:hypothetical protein